MGVPADHSVKTSCNALQIQGDVFEMGGKPLALALEHEEELEQEGMILDVEVGVEDVVAGAEGADNLHGFLGFQLRDEGQNSLCDDLLDVELDHTVLRGGGVGLLLPAGPELLLECFLR